jgi:DNA gyrase/topoisomerase IV subunit A
MMQLTDFIDDGTVTEQENDKKESPVTKNEYPISSVAKNEWKSFAMYTVEARAIPNMIDGLKPVQRFYLYSSILNSKSDFKKVSAISGIISDYGYNHGEASAAGAGQLMAATWNNNICLIEGRGSFGTRLVQDAGAPRYVYTRLHKNFDKYIKDLDISPAHDDPEHEPPAFYLPVIPLVLVNGTKGIATGFATNILPRDPDSLSSACREYLMYGNISRKLPVKFPEFSGTVVYNEDENRYYCKGVFERKSKTVILITDVPYGFDRESYVKVLDDLEESDDIVGYDDLCDKTGFRFEVKLKQNTSANWSDDKIVQKFKLSKPMSENLTVIDHDGKLKEYSDERDLIRDFCKFRLSVLQERIKLRKKEASELSRWLSVKMQFIQAVLDNEIEFKNRKKDEVAKQIFSKTDALTDEDANRLLRINILSLTDEMVKQLEKEIQDANKQYEYWSKTTANEQFMNDLAEIG